MYASDSDWIFPGEYQETPLRHEDVLSRKNPTQGEGTWVAVCHMEVVEQMGFNKLDRQPAPVKCSPGTA